MVGVATAAAIQSIVMRQARLLVCEDSLPARDEVRFSLRRTNHIIIAEAQRRRDALTALRSFRFDVVLLDANLDHPERNGSDGHAIWAEIGKLSVRPYVVGISTNELRGYGLAIPDQYDLTKDRLALLPQVLESLPELVSASVPQPRVRPGEYA